MKKSRITGFATLMAAVGFWAGAGISAPAVTFTASGTGANGQALQATATFQTLAGNKLQITLANSETGDANTTANLLTAIFFDGATGLTPLSAIVPAGQLEWNTTGNGNNAVTASTTLSSNLDVGTQWGYAYTGGSGDESLGANPPNNATAGISSAGLNWFGNGDFDTNGAALDGAPYGLVPLGFMSTGGTHDGLSNGQSNPTFENTAVLTLSNWTGSLSSIANVSFQYGTTSADANTVGVLTAVPEPTTADCFLIGLGVLALTRRFKQNGCV
jgi:hypothetical protein